jgi:hypothetical protein
VVVLAILSVSRALAAADQSAAPRAASVTAPASLQSESQWKPAWLTDAAVTVREGYDDNVLMSGVSQSSVPAGTRTLKDEFSFITTVSPAVGVDFAKLADSGGKLQQLSFAYAPDLVTYHELPSENYNAHRTTEVAKGHAGTFSYSLDNSFLFVDASRVAPSYPGDLFNAWATINAYPRREQLNDRGKLTTQCDWNRWFVRPGASLAYYGMMTEIMAPKLATTPSGYQNYCTRYDVNGGADLGYKFSSNMSATLGYRYGSQGQEQFGFSIDSSPSDYQRVLLGIEGKPLNWLNLQLLGGPDFRSYEGNSATHITPMNDLHPVTYYGEAALSATMTPSDLLTFKYKQYQFVSCLGIKPYFDSSYALSYRHKCGDRLSLDFGARLLDADYTVGNLASCRRNDLDYVLSAAVNYSFTSHLLGSLTYLANLGRNGEDQVVNSQTRDFDSQEASLGMQFKF